MFECAEEALFATFAQLRLHIVSQLHMSELVLGILYISCPLSGFSHREEHA